MKTYTEFKTATRKYCGISLVGVTPVQAENAFRAVIRVHEQSCAASGAESVLKNGGKKSLLDISNYSDLKVAGKLYSASQVQAFCKKIARFDALASKAKFDALIAENALCAS